MRDALKENGIGRPSTRAAIIETLFKREYIRKERKNLLATDTGIELILTIQEDLLKSAELTGQWEKKLRDIDKGTYEARQFLDELKEMLRQIVFNVKSDNRTFQQIKAEYERKRNEEICPKCGKGTILKGRTAFGCSEWKNGCDYRKAFDV